MCREISEEELLLLQEIEDPDELRRLLDAMDGCGDCSCGKSSESGDHDIQCRIHHQMRCRNRLLHILNKIGF